MAAARYAFENKTIACSPSSGFHHAEYNEAGGFCTFNGLAIAAYDILDRFAADRVMIIDFDDHYGNGTDDILDHFGNDVTDQIAHWMYGGRVYGDPYEAMQDLSDWFEQERHSVSLVLYQAGADPHKDDPLSSSKFTTQDLRERDEAVFTMCEGFPMVWNLAGGYQREADGSIPAVLEIHRNTAKEAIASIGCQAISL